MPCLEFVARWHLLPMPLPMPMTIHLAGTFLLNRPSSCFAFSVWAALAVAYRSSICCALASSAWLLHKCHPTIAPFWEVLRPCRKILCGWATDDWISSLSHFFSSRHLRLLPCLFFSSSFHLLNWRGRPGSFSSCSFLPSWPFLPEGWFALDQLLHHFCFGLVSGWILILTSVRPWSCLLKKTEFHCRHGCCQLRIRSPNPNRSHRYQMTRTNRRHARPLTMRMLASGGFSSSELCACVALALLASLC
mmetsp:Transcript_2718/g.7542  ORF Transcript_2718/g.7542 Transcript_2718/m.7542 type:complete len:248 (-) Transcript_2718:2801-3544(-)